MRTFSWDRLLCECTIGCNTAFRLGEAICKICVFGDYTWFKHFRKDLEGFHNPIFTNVSALDKVALPWLWTMKRKGSGLHRDTLGWNGNTGALAINLALLLGAKRIYLMGFDMHRIQDKPNWHDEVIRPEATHQHVYDTFVRAFGVVVRDWHEKFSDREIYNLTTDSGLPDKLIPWIDPETFWKGRLVVGPLGLTRHELVQREKEIADENATNAQLAAEEIVYGSANV